nr:SOUL heme-binding protein [uncultured bacterium]
MKTPIFSFFAALIFAGCSVFGIRTTEEPSYNVRLGRGKIEIREYGAVLLATTRVSSDYEESTSVGFRRLADYIFGKNTREKSIKMTAPVVREEESEKISMTAPVLQETSAGKWTISFVLPANYTLESLPAPLDERITIAEIPAKKVATIRFSGFLDEENYRKKAEELETWLTGKGYTMLSEPRFAAYDPPWTLPFLRRNEVLIDIQ